MNFIDLFKPLPIWAHGLECEICKKTFINARAHYDFAKKSTHLNKIPVLKK